MLPTPPLAPVTSTGPSPGRRPCRSSAATDIAAVNPAVPIAIASRAVRPGGQRHDVAGRQPGELAVAAVPGDAEVVAVGEDRLSDADAGSSDGDDLAGEVDPGDQRADPGDLAVGDRGERVLVVDARPVDADLDLARRQVRRGEVADAALDRRHRRRSATKARKVFGISVTASAYDDPANETPRLQIGRSG